MGERFQNGATVPVDVLALDTAGAELTGATVTLKIQRLTDSLFFDFNDSTWSATPVSLTVNMTEVDATRWAGMYRYSFDTSSMPDDTYIFNADCSTAGNAPYADTAIVGGYVDNLDASVSSVATAVAGVPAAILATAYEGAETLKTWFRVARAALVGKRAGFQVGQASTGTMKALDNSKTRVTYPHDQNGNSTTNITVDGTD